MIINNKKFVDFIILRDIAIIGVVFYHSVSGVYNLNNTDKNLNLLFQQVFMFLSLNMAMIPLFVFISGYLFAYSEIVNPKNPTTIIINKVKRLLLPYIVFAILFEILSPVAGFQLSFNTSFANIIKGADHLWYLLMLFCCFFMFSLVKKSYYYLIFILFLYILYFIMLNTRYEYLTKILSFKNFIYFFPWFCIGYLSCIYTNYLKLLSSIFCLIILASSYFSIIVISIYEGKLWIGFINEYISYIAQFLSVLILWLFASKMTFKKDSVLFSNLIKLDSMSFGIYIFHMWVIHFFIKNQLFKSVSIFFAFKHPIFYVILLFISSLIISFFIINLVKRTSFGRTLLG